MNYDAWRNSPEVREKMKRLALWLEAGTPSPVIEQSIENLLREAWINGTGQGAAEERRIREEIGS